MFDGTAAKLFSVSTAFSETACGRVAARAAWMPCRPLPEGIIARPMTAALSARRRANGALMLVGKRPYIAATAPLEARLHRGKPAGGEGEIRTLDGPVTHNGFRDRRLQPLGHLSGASHGGPDRIRTGVLGLDRAACLARLHHGTGDG